MSTDNNGFVQKDKDSTLDYSVDWGPLLEEGESVASSSWTADTGITLDTTILSGNVATVFVSGGTPGQWYALTNTVATNSAPPRIDQRVIKLYVAADVTAQAAGSALFPSRLSAISSIRNDRLALAAAGAFPGVSITDDYIWEKLLAAEAETSRDLRVYLQPTIVIPDDAPQTEVDALEASGQAWAQEAAYDYDSSFFRGEKWGYMLTKSKPIISVQSLRFVYPTNLQQIFEIPHDWIRLDKKYGHLRLVPTNTSFAAPLAAFALQVMGGGGMIPFMLQLRYTAGLTNATQNWPDLVDVVKKRAVLGIINDAYLPQSGSISADGLSQSMSVDASKYADIIDAKLNGGKGSNGGLMTAIHGIRFGVMGSV